VPNTRRDTLGVLQNLYGWWIVDVAEEGAPTAEDRLHPPPCPVTLTGSALHEIAEPIPSCPPVLLPQQ
jgi:hypothetical protein